MSSLQDKMYNYEQTPPPKVWEKIAAALDESNLSDEFPSKLYNAEVTPPATAWDKIKTSLEPAPETAKRRVIPFFRYAAAAILIGIIAFSIIKLTTGNNGDSVNEGIVSTKDTTREKQEHNVVDNNLPVNNQPKKEDTDTNTEITSSEPVQEVRTQRARTNYAVRNTTDDMNAIYAFNEHTPNLSDRYIMLMTPNGNIIRMSKKWGDLVCCVSGEERDKDCQDQIKRLQEKLATSPATSPGNFMDILSLVSSLSKEEL